MRNSRRRTTILWAGLGMLFAVDTSRAQRIAPVVVVPQPSLALSAYQPPRQPINSTRGIVGGVLGAYAGPYAGGMLGNAVASDRPSCDDCGYAFLFDSG